MSNKPKWFVELHGVCPHPELFEVIQPGADPAVPVSPFTRLDHRVGTLEDAVERLGVGESETAFFVVVGGESTTDPQAGDTVLAFAADTRDGASLPSWVSLIDGRPVLGEEAGTCAFAFAGVAEIDFTSSTRAPDSTGLIQFGGRPVLNGTGGDFTVSTPVVGTGAAIQATGLIRIGGVVPGGTLLVEASANAYADGVETEADPIIDGAVVFRCAMTITRIAQAPVIPV